MICLLLMPGLYYFRQQGLASFITYLPANYLRTAQEATHVRPQDSL